MYTEYLTAIVSPIVLHPDSIKVDSQTDEQGPFLTLQLHKEDMGRIIGKEGATAKAIRHLIRNLGMRNNVKMSVVILEPDGSRRKTTERN